MTEKLKMHSPDLVLSNIDKIADLFPNCVTEAAGSDGKITRKIDFDLLRQELSDEIVEGPLERYQLNWPGKRDAILGANAPIAKTLRPSREESVDFDNTRNLFVEGDNLEALKLLQETYLAKVDLIYIDPPYNTDGDLIYRDNFSMPAEEYLLFSKEVSSCEEQLVANKKTDGRRHSTWLSFIMPRIKVARNLLRPNGCMVIHIDENEVSNIIKMIQELFGDENILGVMVWDKMNPKGDATKIAVQNEFLVCVARDYEQFKMSRSLKRRKPNAERTIRKAKRLFAKVGSVTPPDDLVDTDQRYDLGIDLKKYAKEYDLSDANKEFRRWLSKQDMTGGELAYKHIDNNGNVYRTVSMAWPNRKKAPDDYFLPLIHPVTGNPCPVPEKGWRNPSSTMRELLANQEIIFGEDETKQPERKYLLSDNLLENVPSVVAFGGSDEVLLRDLNIPFDNPKPIAFAKQILDWFISDQDSIVLDFFSGSGTVAAAIMELNSTSRTNHRFIMVQIPEKVEHSLKYESISDICKDRIRKASNSLRTTVKDFVQDTDFGFRVLKIDSTNMKDVYYSPADTSQGMLSSLVDNIKPDRTGEDLLFQVLLDCGVDLGSPIKSEKIEGCEFFIVNESEHAAPDLVACFDSEIPESLIKTIADKTPLRAVFRDQCFSTDADKINVEQIFKQLSPNTQLRSL